MEKYPYPCGVDEGPARDQWHVEHDAEIAALDAEIERGTQRDNADREDAQNAGHDQN